MYTKPQSESILTLFRVARNPAVTRLMLELLTTSQDWSDLDQKLQAVEDYELRRSTEKKVSSVKQALVLLEQWLTLMEQKDETEVRQKKIELYWKLSPYAMSDPIRYAMELIHVYGVPASRVAIMLNLALPQISRANKQYVERTRFLNGLANEICTI